MGEQVRCREGESQMFNILAILAAAMAGGQEEKEMETWQRDREWGLNVNVLWYEGKAYALTIRTP